MVHAKVVKKNKLNGMVMYRLQAVFCFHLRGKYSICVILVYPRACVQSPYRREITSQACREVIAKDGDSAMYDLRAFGR